MGGTTEERVIGKDEYLFLSLSITSLSVPHQKAFFFLSRWRQLKSLPLSCLLKVTFYLWPSTLARQQLP